MTEAQERHVQELINTFAIHLRAKYEKGAKEHGGNLWDMTPVQLVEEAIQENIDQYTYLVTARRKMLL